jgi:hypothetical protein
MQRPVSTAGPVMPYLIAAALILFGGALSFGMAGKKLKRPKRWKRRKAPSEEQTKKES